MLVKTPRNLSWMILLCLSIWLAGNIQKKKKKKKKKKKNTYIYIYIYIYIYKYMHMFYNISSYIILFFHPTSIRISSSTSNSTSLLILFMSKFLIALTKSL
ncbi:hypothetical protein PFLG_02877 [Plasmodium falciparum RAJ116]|uniref:Uncharacterized protein n=1 Tax=Plasmodium falciparum RAJ116 TaxID=580058 RepID=A0A0L0D1U5_PLAFA|nr:hypothetical protein PFLG_02877 [Plasmodium falciparum RAJ116]